jgi:Xaa-Pro aminopeptidase
MNRQRATDLMLQHGVAAIVGTSYQSLLYASQYEVFEGPWNHFGQSVVIPQDASRPVVAVLPTLEIGHLIDAGLDRRSDVQLFGNPTSSGGNPIWEGRYDDLMSRVQPTIVSAIVAALDAAGVHGRVAVQSSAQPSSADLKAADTKRDYVEHGEDLLYLARLVKTNAEIELLQRAAAINEAGMRAAVAGAGEFSVAEAGSLFTATVVHAGAQPMHFIVDDAGAYRHWGFGGRRRLSGMTARADSRLAPGARCRYDAGVMYEGYVSDLGGTFLIGTQPSSEDERIFGALRAGIEAGMAGVRPGMKASELTELVLSTVRSSGKPDFVNRPVGHFIGIDHLEGWIGTPVPTNSPFIPNPFDVEFETNMVFNFEVPQVLPGVGGYQYEITCVLTDGGAVPISPRRTLEMVG